MRDGSHAEYAVVPAETFSLKPKSLSMAHAAAIGVPYITAWASLVNAAEIQAGEIVLIVGAVRASGTSSHSDCQLEGACDWSANTSDPIQGIESVVNTKAEDLCPRVLELTDGRGVDAVFDTVGGPMFEQHCGRSGSAGGRWLSQAQAIRNELRPGFETGVFETAEN